MTQETAPKLRIDFIGMMFALAVGQVGLEIGDFFNNGSKISSHFYVLSHLALSIYIIASSWIGWQTSKSRGSEEALNDSFSLSFIILLIDLFLVICYFILVKAVEKPSQNILTSAPDCSKEIFWSGVILITYFLWDIVTKLITVTDRDNMKIKLDWKPFCKRGYQSLLCFLILLIFIAPMRNITSYYGVIVTDIALFLTFGLFRGLKYENIIRRGSKVAASIRVSLYIIVPVVGIIITIIINNYIHV